MGRLYLHIVTRIHDYIVAFFTALRLIETLSAAGNPFAGCLGYLLANPLANSLAAFHPRCFSRSIAIMTSVILNFRTSVAALGIVLGAVAGLHTHFRAQPADSTCNDLFLFEPHWLSGIG
jgi:hypothetical protein